MSINLEAVTEATLFFQYILYSDCSLNLNENIHLSNLGFFSAVEEWRLVQSLKKKKNAQLQDELEFKPEITSEWPEE